MTHGGSPGNGFTPAKLSRDPIATEGEATPGPDDWNPYEQAENRRALREFERQQTEAESPTSGNDPFVFDDIGAGLENTLGNVGVLPSFKRDGPQF